MAGSVNKVILVGNLGRDPEVRRLNNGSSVVNLRIATSESWRDKNSGERQERTEWHNVVVWGKQAETCGQYLSKGRQVFLEGSIRSRQYDDKDGSKRYITEVIAQRVQFLGNRGGGAGPGAGDAPSRGGGGSSEPPPPPLAEDDDIPF
jgi:single-strand DNA-binding protein